MSAVGSALHGRRERPPAAVPRAAVARENGVPPARRYVPHVAAATVAVAVLPIAAAWSLRAAGAISSVSLSVLVALALAVGAALAGNALWQRRRAPEDPYFAELLPWGWLRRLRAERQLADATALLELTGGESAPLGLAGSETEELRRVASRQKTAHLLTRLAGAVEARNPHFEGHSRRVVRYAEMIARTMGLSDEQMRKIRTAAELHDIGELRVPAEVMGKPGPLTRREFELLKRHADEGAAIVACLRDPELTRMVRHHHEHFDGTGYPSGLLAMDIPLGARIIAVAEAFDAMTAPRPYRAATPKKWAIATLLNASGGQLDPAVVASFLRSYPRQRATALWSLLALSPQPMVAWLRGRRSAAADLSLAGMLAVVALIAAMGSIAIGIPSGVARVHGQLQGAHPATARQIASTPRPLTASTPAAATPQTQVLGTDLVTKPHRPAAHHARKARAGRHRARHRGFKARRYRSSSRRISRGGSSVRSGRGGSRIKHRFGSGRPRRAASGTTGPSTTAIGGGTTGTSGGGTTVAPGDGPGGKPKDGPGGKPNDGPGSKPLRPYGD